MEPGGEPFASFETWASARQHGLLRSAVLITGDIHRAEDLVQDALFKMALRWDRLRGGNPDAYVRTIVYRTHVSWWRARRETPVAHVQDTAGPIDDAERPLIVQDALARLTAKQRAVLVLRYFDDLTESETAHVLGVSVGSVKKHAAVAKQRLREVAPELEDLADLRDDTP
jgi:RNA polymerase sigma-70 factor (sigma-E family)